MKTLEQYIEWYKETYGKRPSEKLIESFCKSNGIERRDKEMKENKRLDFAFSVLSQSENDIEIAKESNNLKNKIGQVLCESGYKKFVVVDSDWMDEKLKDKLHEEGVEQCEAYKNGDRKTV